MTKLDLSDDSMCFACSKRNPDGLHLEFTETSDGLSTTIAFDERFQGYRDIVQQSQGVLIEDPGLARRNLLRACAHQYVHGGLVSTVLDEAMVTLLNRTGVLALTAELTIRFLAPVRVGEPITFTARLVESRRNVYRVEAVATRNGETVARSEARFMAVGTVATRAAS